MIKKGIHSSPSYRAASIRFFLTKTVGNYGHMNKTVYVSGALAYSSIIGHAYQNAHPTPILIFTLFNG